MEADTLRESESTHTDPNEQESLNVDEVSQKAKDSNRSPEGLVDDEELETYPIEFKHFLSPEEIEDAERGALANFSAQATSHVPDLEFTQLTKANAGLPEEFFGEYQDKITSCLHRSAIVGVVTRKVLRHELAKFVAFNPGLNRNHVWHCAGNRAFLENRYEILEQIKQAPMYSVFVIEQEYPRQWHMIRDLCEEGFEELASLLEARHSKVLFSIDIGRLPSFSNGVSVEDELISEWVIQVPLIDSILQYWRCEKVSIDAKLESDLRKLIDLLGENVAVPQFEKIDSLVRESDDIDQELGQYIAQWRKHGGQPRVYERLQAALLSDDAKLVKEVILLVTSHVENLSFQQVHWLCQLILDGKTCSVRVPIEVTETYGDSSTGHVTAQQKYVFKEKPATQVFESRFDDIRLELGIGYDIEPGDSPRLYFEMATGKQWLERQVRDICMSTVYAAAERINQPELLLGHYRPEYRVALHQLASSLILFDQNMYGLQQIRLLLEKTAELYESSKHSHKRLAKLGANLACIIREIWRSGNQDDIDQIVALLANYVQQTSTKPTHNLIVYIVILELRHLGLLRGRAMRWLKHMLNRDDRRCMNFTRTFFRSRLRNSTLGMIRELKSISTWLPRLNTDQSHYSRSEMIALEIWINTLCDPQNFSSSGYSKMRGLTVECAAIMQHSDIEQDEFVLGLLEIDFRFTLLMGITPQNVYSQIAWMLMSGFNTALIPKDVWPRLREDFWQTMCQQVMPDAHEWFDNTTSKLDELARKYRYLLSEDPVRARRSAATDMTEVPELDEILSPLSHMRGFLLGHWFIVACGLNSDENNLRTDLENPGHFVLPASDFIAAQGDVHTLRDSVLLMKRILNTFIADTNHAAKFLAQDGIASSGWSVPLIEHLQWKINCLESFLQKLNGE